MKFVFREILQKNENGPYGQFLERHLAYVVLYIYMEDRGV